jgi:hypothetical protein
MMKYQIDASYNVFKAYLWFFLIHFLVGFCLRFANDFETSWDDWKPDSTEDPVMNACVVPEGTYEVCSRTITKQVSGTAVWETIFFKHSPKWRVDWNKYSPKWNRARHVWQVTFF